MRVGGPLTITREFQPSTQTLVRYAGASGDFYEIHYDEDIAAANDLSDLPVHGLLKMSWLVDLAEELVGADPVPTHIECRYSSVDYRRRTLRCHAQVVSQDDARIEVRMWTEDGQGTKTCMAHATFAL